MARTGAPRLRAYAGRLGRVLVYQLLTKGLLLLCLWGLRQLVGTLLWVIGRGRFNSGDMPYLMRTWQGWVLLGAGLMGLIVYGAVDLCGLVLMSRSVLGQRRESVLRILRRAFSMLPRFLCPRGVLAVLAVSLILPLTGTALGVSLTTGFSIPNYLRTYLVGNLPLRLLFDAGVLLLWVLAAANVFTFHGVVLGGRPVAESMRFSRRIMARHGRQVLARMLKVLAEWALALALMILLLVKLPYALLDASGALGAPARFGNLMIMAMILCSFGLYGLLFLPVQVMHLTLIQDDYTDIVPGDFQAPPPRGRRFWILCAVSLLVACAVVSGALTPAFYFIFPWSDNPELIAHRGAGVLSTENTVEALETAIDRGCYASEIDVQRTADGAYIVLHDSTFARVCGVRRKPSEMTLEEVKQLRVGGTAEVATMEEMLDAARGRIHLYIELKGESIDLRMAEDLYRMVAERDMLRQCAFISLHYWIIDALETLHPDAETIYLSYYSFGRLENLNCDGLGIEAASATARNIRRIHLAGKRVDVWTCNTIGAISQVALSEADGIITDEIDRTEGMLDAFTRREFLARILNRILPEF